jgi:hypothetical protein
MNKYLQVLAIFGMTATAGTCAEMTIADFEGAEPDKWTIPDWAKEKADHVAQAIEVSKEVASKGSQSLKVDCAFPGDKWTTAVVETEDYLDLTDKTTLAFDVYIPKDAPEGLKGNICVTYGSGWAWAEQMKDIPIKPGVWNPIEVDISNTSKDWKKLRIDEEFRGDIRKIDLRVISDKKPSYLGPVFIDNVRAY